MWRERLTDVASLSAERLSEREKNCETQSARYVILFTPMIHALRQSGSSLRCFLGSVCREEDFVCEWARRAVTANIYIIAHPSSLRLQKGNP